MITSYEPIAILLVSAIQVAGLLMMLRTVVLGFREMTRDHEVIAGLLVQESEKVQQLLRA